MEQVVDLLLLFFSAFLGGIAVFFIKPSDNKTLKLILSFSGAYLFAICVLHLVPEAYASHNPLVGVFVLLGFAFQIVLEQFSEGVEHGHIHLHQHVAAVPIGVMVSLCLHAFLEVLPLAQSDAREQLVWGISMHHIPAAFALGSILQNANKNKAFNIFLLAIFALMSPFGLLFSELMNQKDGHLLAEYFDYITAVVIGIFLHISTTILFESSEDHKFNFKKVIAIFLGAGIAVGLFFLQGGLHEHHH